MKLIASIWLCLIVSFQLFGNEINKEQTLSTAFSKSKQHSSPKLAKSFVDDDKISIILKNSTDCLYIECIDVEVGQEKEFELQKFDFHCFTNTNLSNTAKIQSQIQLQTYREWFVHQHKKHRSNLIYFQIFRI